MLNGGGRFPATPVANIWERVPEGLEVASGGAADGVEGVSSRTGVIEEAGESKSEEVRGIEGLVWRVCGLEVEQDTCPGPQKGSECAGGGGVGEGPLFGTTEGNDAGVVGVGEG